METQLDMKTRVQEILEFGGMIHAIPLTDELSSNELAIAGNAVAGLKPRTLPGWSAHARANHRRKRMMVISLNTLEKGVFVELVSFAFDSPEDYRFVDSFDAQVDQPVHVEISSVKIARNMQEHLLERALIMSQEQDTLADVPHVLSITLKLTTELNRRP